ncbi:hypothetical protein [Hymenobacter sp. B1770]|uniref:hypothetical protein n=1 Tax=Hymenobacter sp. B1770 TaxID=1718788 RepID=UPI003CE9C6B9
MIVEADLAGNKELLARREKAVFKLHQALLFLSAPTDEPGVGLARGRVGSQPKDWQHGQPIAQACFGLRKHNGEWNKAGLIPLWGTGWRRHCSRILALGQRGSRHLAAMPGGAESTHFEQVRDASSKFDVLPSLLRLCFSRFRRPKAEIS